jgi:hypothetical protein
MIGLCNLFIGAPAAVDSKGRISEWSSTYDIWRREDFGAGDVPTTQEPPPPKPPVERTAPVTLAMKSVKRIQNK